VTDDDELHAAKVSPIEGATVDAVAHGEGAVTVGRGLHEGEHTWANEVTIAGLDVLSTDLPGHNASFQIGRAN
jgi:hypothetical protein